MDDQILRQILASGERSPRFAYANDEDYAEALRELLGKAISDRIRTIATWPVQYLAAASIHPPLFAAFSNRSIANGRP